MIPHLVTIAVPTFRRLNYLIEAVESALAQTWPHVEVLVGDNGTTSDIPEWCRERAANDPRLRYHRNARDLGYAGNLNAIAERSTGEFIVFMSDDDRLLPQFAETLIAAATPESAVVFCNHYVIDSAGRRLVEETARVTSEYHRAELTPGTVPSAATCAWQMALLPAASMVRTDHVRRLRLHEDLTSPDIEFFIRLASLGARFEFVSDYLAEYRVHGNTVTQAGLRHDRLVSRLLAIEATPDVEPFKRQLLEHLLVTGASRALGDGDRATASALLSCHYYPRRERRFAYLLQKTCAQLPETIGAPLYRTVLKVKHARRA